MVRVKAGIGKGVLHPVEGQRKFSTARFEPCEALTPFVEHFWTVAWQLPDGAVFVQETLPYPCVHMAFEREQSEVVCVMRGRFRRQLVGSGRVFAVRFKPGGFFSFLPENQSLLQEKRISVNRVLPDLDLAEFEQQLFAKESELEMASLLEQTLLDCQPSSSADVELVQSCYRMIEQDPDVSSVAILAHRFQFSVRTLQRKFAQVIGVSPKWVIQRIRLQDALEQVQSSQESIAEIAANLGYADQAHFSREFRAVVRVSPRQYKTQC